MSQDNWAMIRGRLADCTLQTAFCEMVAKQLALARLLESKDLGWRSARLIRRKHRTRKLPWSWPLSALPELILDLQQPAQRDMSAARQFFAAHHLLNCIAEPRRRFSDYLDRLQLPEYPFVVVALAALYGKTRQLDRPRVPMRQFQELSDVEVELAGLIWGFTRRAFSELAEQFQTRRIAVVCEHCGALSANFERKYCSDICMKAAVRRRRHLRKPSAKR